MELRLGTFNLENLGIREEEDSPSLQARLPLHVESVRGALRRLDADAVAVQEVLDPSLLTDLADSLDYPYILFGQRSSSPLLVGVISRYPLKNPRAVAQAGSVTVADEKTGMEVSVKGAFSRSVLQVTWEVPGFDTELFVVHWKSKIPTFVPTPGAGREEQWASLGQVGEGRLITEVKRLAQAVALRKVIDGTLRSDGAGRVVVLGDFNDSLDSECLRILRGDSRACDAPALVPWELLPCELSLPKDLRFTQIYRGHREMLDHVLISRELLPHFRSMSILNEDLAEAVEGPHLDPYSYASDHAPVVVTFRT